MHHSFSRRWICNCWPEKWLRQEGYRFADRYASSKLPLDELRIAYDQKLRYSTLQLHVPPELGRKLPGLLYTYDDCGPIYCNLPDPTKDNRCIYSQRVDRDILQVCFITMGECELPKTLEETKSSA
ncbi:hypothetical protein IW262DRAFT_256147 [Armillaria fumosa]|nr:hypothetical protein IW262DRAFT_256147 [Armillaria fumosa]